MIRINGNLGCLYGILVIMLFISLFMFLGRVVFTTPIGLVLLAIVIYQYYKRRRHTKHDVEFDESQHHEFKNTDEVIDVEFEEYDQE